jgi:uncharacterized protein with PIN domain
VTVRLLVAEPLRMFLAARHRAGTVEVEQDGTSSLGHLVQSVGVPLPEVGRLAVQDRPVPPGHRPRDGDVVTVLPVARPQPGPPRYLLDVHLGVLARRMRLLGIDTSYPAAAHDDELVTAALVEDRVLLTQDRGLLQRRALRHAAYVRGRRPDDQLADVLSRFAPALAPFTRCLACNGHLLPVAKAEVLQQLKPGTIRSYDEFARCRACGRVYWEGAHAARLHALVTDARILTRT